MDLPNGWLLQSENGVESRVYDGDKPGEFVTSNKQYWGDALDENTELRSYGTMRKSKEGIGPMVARVPRVIHEMLQSTGIGKDPRALREWLDRPENAAFRTNNQALSPAGMKRKYGK